MFATLQPEAFGLCSGPDTVLSIVTVPEENRPTVGPQKSRLQRYFFFFSLGFRVMLCGRMHIATNEEAPVESLTDLAEWPPYCQDEAANS